MSATMNWQATETQIGRQDVISLEYKPRLDIAFDEERFSSDLSWLKMLGSFDAYIGEELFISVDKARGRRKNMYNFEREITFWRCMVFCISTAMIVIHRKKKQKCLAYRKKF